MGDNYMIISSLKSSLKLALMPPVGEGQGEGGLNSDEISFVHPHPHPPPSKGEGTGWEISNIFG